MNANKKIILIAGGAVLLLLFVFAAIMLFRGIRQFGTAEQNLANARSQLNTFYKKKPFPVGKNIATVKSNSDLMEDWMRDIVDVAKRKQVDPAETRSPSVFINMLAKIRNGLQSKAKHAGVAIDEEFGFGFDRYVAGEPATADYVPRLIQQLLIVNEICGILIDEKVKEISLIRREQFEGERASATRQVRPRNRPTSRSNKTVAMSPAAMLKPAAPDPMAGEFADDDAIDAKIKFSFDFTAKESDLIDVLNKLAQNEMFIVVTAVDIESTEPPSATPAEKKKEAATRSRAATDPFSLFSSKNTPSSDETSEEPEKPAFQRTPSREERVVFGGKVEQPSRVHLELEVYRFR